MMGYRQYGPIMNGGITPPPDAAIRYRTILGIVIHTNQIVYQQLFVYKTHFDSTL